MKSISTTSFIVFLIFFVWNIAQAQYTQCEDSFWDTFSIPCECLYKNHDWYSEKKLEVANRLLLLLENQSQKFQKNAYPKVRNILMNKIGLYNQKKIIYTKKRKEEFFWVANYLMCEIDNQYHLKTYLERFPDSPRSISKINTTNWTPANYKKLDIKDELGIVVYKKDNPNAVYLHDYIIKNISTNTSISLSNQTMIVNIQKWTNGIYLLSIWANGFSTLSVIQESDDSIKISDILTGWPEQLSINNFELLNNKKIKVFYWYSSQSMEKIIGISEILSE